jgi:hypothetical protein
MRIISIILLFCPILLLSQNESKPETEPINRGTHFRAIGLELLAISYRSETFLNEKWAAGVGFQVGFGYRIPLNKPTYMYKEQSPDWEEVDMNHLIELVKVKPVVSCHFSENAFVSFGLYGSFIILRTGTGAISAGLDCSFFYGFKRVKLGHQLQIGNIYIIDGLQKHGNSNIFTIMLTPVIFQINF